MLSFWEHIKENVILTEKAKGPKLAGGKGADVRGRISEQTMFHSINNYMDRRRRGDTHEEALEHLRSPKHFKKVKGQVDESLSFHDPDDFHQTAEDSAHAAADYLDHIHKNIGEMDVEGQTHLTGPLGEKVTAREIGYTNADLIIPMKGKKDRIEFALSRPNHRGNSLKYTTEKSNYAKVRQHGEQQFNGMIDKLANKAYSTLAKAKGREHPDAQKLESTSGEGGLIPNISKLRRRIEKARGSLAGVGWESFFDDHKEVRKLIEKHHPGATVNTLDNVLSALRKIKRNDSSKMPGTDTSQVPRLKADELSADQNLASHYEKGLSQMKSSVVNDVQHEHVSRTAELLNHVYDALHRETDPDIRSELQSHVNEFHRRLGDIQPRKRKFRKLPDGQIVPVVRTDLVVIHRNGKDQKPSTGIHSLTNRMEELSRSTGRWEANSSGGSMEISLKNDQTQQRDSVARISTDATTKIINMSPKKNIMVPGVARRNTGLSTRLPAAFVRRRGSK